MNKKNERLIRVIAKELRSLENETGRK